MKNANEYQDFDVAAAERIDRRQKKPRPKVDTNVAKSTITGLLARNKNSGFTHTPFSKEDIPSNSIIVENQQPGKLPPKKKKELPLYQPRIGSYQERLNSKTSHQGHALTSNAPSNSKPTTAQNVEKNLSRNRTCEKNSQNSWDVHENSNNEVIELQNSQGSFFDDRLVKRNKHSVITVTKKICKNDYGLDSKTSELASDASSSGLNGNLTSVHDITLPLRIPNKNDGILVSDASELPQKSSDFSIPGPNGDLTSTHDLTQPPTISKNVGILVSDVPALSVDFGSPGTNGEFSSMCDFAESSLFNDNWSEDYIPPPKPVSSNACTTSKVSEIEHNLKSDQLSNLNHLILEDHFPENWSIHPNKLDLQMPVPAEGNEVKPAAACENAQFSEVQSIVSKEDDHGEIDQFLQKLQSEKFMQKNIAEKILNDLKSFLRYYFNGNSVKLYGSYLYDAAISTSDINLALVTDQTGKNIKNNFLLNLQKDLAKKLKGYQVFPFEENVNPSRSKICFVDDEHGISCELTYLGSKVSQYLKLNNMLKSVCDFDPRIKSLVIVTKLWAEACEINEAENSMLHSIGFVLLVLHFLQQLEKPLLPLLDVSSKNWGLNELLVRNNSSLGELWLDLLKYYGSKFNWHEYVITVTDKTPVPKTSKLWDISWIAIEDPISGKNVADSVITSDTAEFITSCFEKSYQYFTSDPCDSDSSSSSGSDHSDSQKIRKCSTFKLSDCISRPPPIFLSDDDDSVFEYCCVPKRVAAEGPLKFSKINEVSLQSVNRVLHEVYEEYKLPDNQVKGRQAFVKDLESYIRKIYPEAKLNLFGSTVNGFAFKRSDLDICMTFGGKYQKNNSSASVLKKLVYHLRRRGDLKNVFGLYSAQIPIIKFNFTHQNWHCDLSFYNVLAVHNSNLLYKYSMMDERCKILGCCLKFLAKKTCIAECSSNTLSSYSYILMVIHFLQQVNPPVLPVMPIDDKEVFAKEIDEKELGKKGVLQNRNYWFSEDSDQLKKRYLRDERNTLTVGELWLEMLEYYLKYDYERAVCITEKNQVASSSLLRHACLINIEDPFLSKRNLACILSEDKAVETRKVFHRARMLFGSEYPCEKMEILRDHYFSPSNLTGRIMKNIECSACGGFGHETKVCPKADPFKNRKPWNRSRNGAQKSSKLNTRKL